MDTPAVSADKNLPFEFYIRDKLLSKEYRALFTKGDKKRLDRMAIKNF